MQNKFLLFWEIQYKNTFLLCFLNFVVQAGGLPQGMRFHKTTNLTCKQQEKLEVGNMKLLKPEHRKKTKILSQHLRVKVSLRSRKLLLDMAGIQKR